MSSQLTFPPLIPFVIFLSMMVGAPFTQTPVNFENATFDFNFIKQNLVQYIIGSVILSVTCAVVFGFAAYFILNFFNAKRKSAH